MNRTGANGFKAQTEIEPLVPEDLGKSDRPGAMQDESAKQPYIPKLKQKAALKENARVLVIGGGIAFILLLLAIGAIPRKPLALSKRSVTREQEQHMKTPDDGAAAAGSIVPLMDSGRRPEEGIDSSMVRPDEIARTANKQPKPSPGTNLGSIPPFENAQAWQPEPYHPETQPASVAQGQV
ncbi:MAG: hypothetical protein ACRD4I_04545, partial [Candidatus Angelobacter sp.]